MREGGAGEVGPRGHRRHQDQSERQQAQGDELRAHERDRAAPRAGGGRVAAERGRLDEAEDAQYGKGKRGDELPEELARRESRLKKIRAAKAELEQEAKEKAEQQRAEAEAKLAERREQESADGQEERGRNPKVPDPEQAKPAERRSATSPIRTAASCRTDANKGSFIQAYNAQAAVDGDQVIVAAEVTQETNDRQQLLPMIEQAVVNLKQKPEKVSADAGYFSAANLNDKAVKGIDLHLATGRDKHRDPVE